MMICVGNERSKEQWKSAGVNWRTALPSFESRISLRAYKKLLFPQLFSPVTHVIPDLSRISNSSKFRKFRIKRREMFIAVRLSRLGGTVPQSSRGRTDCSPLQQTWNQFFGRHPFEAKRNDLAADPMIVLGHVQRAEDVLIFDRQFAKGDRRLGTQDHRVALTGTE